MDLRFFSFSCDHILHEMIHDSQNEISVKHKLIGDKKFTDNLAIKEVQSF